MVNVNTYIIKHMINKTYYAQMNKISDYDNFYPEIMKTLSTKCLF